MLTRRVGWLTLAAVLLGALAGGGRQAMAERPAATRLLPETTLAMARVADTPLLLERFRETGIGRMARDPQLKPLAGQVYVALQEAWKQIEPRVGLPLDQLLQIPQGEICVALAAAGDERPGLVLLLDAKGQIGSARTLLAKVEDQLRERGGAKTSEWIEQAEVSVLTGRDGTPLCLVEGEGTLVLTTSRELMRSVLRAWQGADVRTLADNSRFDAIMSRCGEGEAPPQVTWYVDPIELVRRMARGSWVAGGLALFPVLGLDGIHGVGGSMTFGTGDYDSVHHVHLLLDNLRGGVLDAVALSSGDTTPEAWVPPDSISYSTIHWDANQTFRAAARLYNSVVGEERAMEELVRSRVMPALGVDFEKDILPLLAGRASLAQWVERPVRINSVTTLVGVRLTNSSAFQPVLEKVMQRHASRVDKQLYGSVTYWSIRVPQRPQRENGPALRQPQPCVGIVGDYLLFTDSMQAFQEAVAISTDPSRGLAGALDYKLIADKIRRQPGGEAPGAISFSRPEEGLRFWYELASSEETKRRLAERAEGNMLFRSLDQALKDHPLPPFSVLSQYVAPGGAMLVRDDSGLHYMAFTLQRQ